MRPIVTFRVGDSRFGLPAQLVREVVEPGESKHRLPAGGASRVDLVKVRERWLPVVRIPGAPRDPGVDEMILVLGRGRRVVGVLVHELGEVVTAKGEEGGARGEGLIEIAGELVRVLDPDTLLSRSGELLEEGESPMEESRAQAEPRRIVAFRVGGEEFGLDVMNVLEVLRLVEVREVPRAPDFVEGVVEVRDSVVPVIDVRTRFNVPEADRGRDERLLVSEGEHGRVGLVVDEVSGVVQIPEDAIDAPPDFFKGLAGRYLRGIARLRERMLILLDIDEILSSQERIDLQRMMDSLETADSSAATGGRPSEPAKSTKTKASRGGKRSTKRSKGKRSAGKKKGAKKKTGPSEDEKG